MIYDLVYDDTGTIIDAITIESGHGNGNKHVLTKIQSVTSGGNYQLYYNNGSIGMGRLKNESSWKNINNSSRKEEYSIIRYVTTKQDGNISLKYDGEKEKELTDKTKDRLKFSKLYIEKTVNVHADDIVEENEILTYSIKVKNNSNSKYENDLIVTENIPEYVTYENESMEVNGSTELPTTTEDENGKITRISYNIGELESKEEVIIKYSVKVKENCKGQIIQSNGTVGNIKSAVVRNKIGNNLTEEQENNIKSVNFEDIKIKDDEENETTATGKQLINEIYKQEIGIDLNLDLFDITNLIDRKNVSSNEKIKLNSENPLKDAILNKYWNAMHYYDGVYNLMMFEGYTNIDRRADTINSENFKTGDILIYTNANDVKNGNLITNENGEYAYIYIEGKGFVGVNYGADGIKETEDDRNEFNYKYYTDKGLNVYSDANETDENILEYANYQTLLGKDYYVILRPSLMMCNINYELDCGENSELNPTLYLKGDTISKELKNPTKSGYVFEGWYLDSEYTNSVTEISGIEEDITLYAKWRLDLILKEDSKLSIKEEEEEQYIANIEKETTIETLKNNITEGYEIKVYNNTKDNKAEVTDNNEKIKTNMKVEAYKDGAKVNEYLLVVKGDCNGTGTVNVADLTSLMQSVVEDKAENKNQEKILQGAFKMAVDFNESNTLNVSDITLLSKYIADNK